MQFVGGRGSLLCTPFGIITCIRVSLQVFAQPEPARLHIDKHKKMAPDDFHIVHAGRCAVDDLAQMIGGGGAGYRYPRVGNKASWL
jgi:hypothetical protein